MVKKRPTVHLSEDVFSKLDEYIAIWGNTKESIVSQAVLDYVYTRQIFLKMYAPHLTFESSSTNAIFINDEELDEIAVVKIQRSKDLEKSDGLVPSCITFYCQSCKSDGCIHVRYSLLLPEMVRIVL